MKFLKDVAGWKRELQRELTSLQVMMMIVMRKMIIIKGVFQKMLVSIVGF